MEGEDGGADDLMGPIAFDLRPGILEAMFGVVLVLMEAVLSRPSMNY